DGVVDTEPPSPSHAHHIAVETRLREQVLKRYIKIERPRLLVILAAAAAFTVPATIDGKCVDSRSRQLPGHIIPRLTVPIALVEQQHAGTWLGRGKVARLQDSTVRGLQFYYTWSRRLLRLLRLIPPRIRRHYVVRAIVDHKLAVVLAAVLDGERPDGGGAGQSVPKKFRSIVQPRVALLLNHSRSVRDGFLHKLHYVGLRLESVTRRIVGVAGGGPEV